MSTANAVTNDSKMTDEQLGVLTRRTDELKRRINQGTLDYAKVIKRLQLIVEGVAPVFDIWRTIKLGTHPSVADLRKALRLANLPVSDHADSWLEKTPISNHEEEIDLVRVSNANLGFPDGATRLEAYDRATCFGLDLVPAEVGPQLRLQHHDQPEGELILVGMSPFFDAEIDETYRHVFHVVHYPRSGPILCCDCSSPTYVFGPDWYWVFTYRRTNINQ